MEDYELEKPMTAVESWRELQQVIRLFQVFIVLGIFAAVYYWTQPIAVYLVNNL